MTGSRTWGGSRPVPPGRSWHSQDLRENGCRGQHVLVGESSQCSAQVTAISEDFRPRCLFEHRWTILPPTPQEKQRNQARLERQKRKFVNGDSDDEVRRIGVSHPSVPQRFDPRCEQNRSKRTNEGHNLSFGTPVRVSIPWGRAWGSITVNKSMRPKSSIVLW